MFFKCCLLLFILSMYLNCKIIFLILFWIGTAHLLYNLVSVTISCLIIFYVNVWLTQFWILYIYIYRVSQEERTKLREGVPCVKLYRYNPKHVCPKLNGYWDNGQIKLWTSFGSTNDSCQLFSLIYICLPVCRTNSADTRLKCKSLLILQGTRCGFVVSVGILSCRQAVNKPCDVTAEHSSVMYSTLNPMCNYYTRARNFAVQINGFMSLTSYFDVKYRY